MPTNELPQELKCINAGCDETATRVMAWPAVAVRCMTVAPYCDDHAAEVEAMGDAMPAAGPALSESAQRIEGIR